MSEILSTPQAFGRAQPPGDWQSWMRRHWHQLALIVLTLTAALLRLWALDRLPPGIYRDEAYEGLDAQGVLRGITPLFFTANNGREPLFVYLLAPFMALFGHTALALRLLPALAGIALIPATYALGNELLGKIEGLIAAALAVGSVWALALSRLAVRAALLPLLSAVMLTCLARGLRLRRWSWMVAAGFCLALGLYTYLPARFGLLALLVYAGICLLRERRTFWWTGWLAMALTALVAVLPLGGYFSQNPTEFLGRSSQVSILNPVINQGNLVLALVGSVWRTALGFFYRGDFIPRHNIPLRPFLDTLPALAFTGGLYLTLRRQRAVGLGLLVLIWLAMMCLPTILAEGAPHMLRAVGLLPVLYLPAAAAMAWFAERLVHTRAPWLGAALVAVVIAQSGVSGVLAFRKHLASEAVYYNFESGAAQLAQDIQAFNRAGVNESPGRPVLLARRLWDNFPSLRYLFPEGQGLLVLEPSGQLPPNVRLAADRGLLLVLWPFEDNAAALVNLPGGQVIQVREGAYERQDLETEARLLYVTYESAPPGGIANEAVHWEQGITLVRHQVSLVNPGRLLVELYWRADQALGSSYTVFTHLTQDGAVLAQHDGPAAQGYYGTERWRVGDIVVDRHYLDLAQPYDANASQLVVGLYHWPDMTPLKRLDAGMGDDTNYTLPQAESGDTP